MKLATNTLLAFLIWVACPEIAIAGEFKFGSFEFDLPGSWQVKTWETELIATRGDVGSPHSAFIKIQSCVSTESKPCKAYLFYPPPGSNPKNYYCGEIEPIRTAHANGLDEVRKICSIGNAKGKSQIGMLFLTHKQHSLGLVLFVGEDAPAPSEFLNAFISSLVLP